MNCQPADVDKINYYIGKVKIPVSDIPNLNCQLADDNCVLYWHVLTATSFVAEYYTYQLA